MTRIMRTLNCNGGLHINSGETKFRSSRPGWFGRKRKHEAGCQYCGILAPSGQTGSMLRLLFMQQI